MIESRFMGADGMKINGRAGSDNHPKVSGNDVLVAASGDEELLGLKVSHWQTGRNSDDFRNAGVGNDIPDREGGRDYPTGGAEAEMLPAQAPLSPLSTPENFA